MSKKLLAVLLATLLVLALFAGCQKTETNTDTSTDTKTEEKKEETKAEDKKTETKTEEKKEETKKEETKKEETKKEETVESKYPEYLNLEGYVPIVKEGTDITLDVMAGHSFLTASENIEDLWGWSYTENSLNIDVNVTALDSENLASKKNLMFASGDLPDMMLAMGISTNEMLTYGQVNGQLLEMNDYINTELTPGVVECLETFSDIGPAITAPNGKIYTLPFVYYGGEINPTTLDNFSVIRYFINTKFREEAGYMEVPTTFDELLEMFRAEKEHFGDNFYPFGSTAKNGQMMMQFSAANGVVTHSTVAYYPALDIKNDKTVIPVLEPLYADYLAFMKTCWDEGLLPADYFTMDNTQLGAMNAEGRLGSIDNTVPYISCQETFLDWESAVAYVNTDGDTPYAPIGRGSAVGGFCLSANTEYPEVCMRWGAYFFTEEGYALMWSGPYESQTDILYGVKGRYFRESDTSFVAPEFDPDKVYATGYAYNTNRVYPANQSWGWSKARNDGGSYYYDISGIEHPAYDPWKNAFTNADLNYRYLQYQATHDAVVQGYPQYTYLDENAVATITDVTAMVKDYILAQDAKFITGERPLSEVEAYQQELIAMGMEDYLKIYSDYYEATK